MRYTPGMTLDAYMKKHKLSDAEFAEKTGLHRTEVWNYRTGHREPGAKKVALIEDATRGQVRARDFAKVA